MVYQFTLPPLLLYTLETGDARHLTAWASSVASLPPGAVPVASPPPSVPLPASDGPPDGSESSFDEPQLAPSQLARTTKPRAFAVDRPNGTTFLSWRLCSRDSTGSSPPGSSPVAGRVSPKSAACRQKTPRVVKMDHQSFGVRPTPALAPRGLPLPRLQRVRRGQALHRPLWIGEYPDCLDRQPGETFCQDEDVYARGPDTITTHLVEDCPRLCVDAACADTEPCPKVTRVSRRALGSRVTTRAVHGDAPEAARAPRAGPFGRFASGGFARGLVGGSGGGAAASCAACVRARPLRWGYSRNLIG